MRCGEDESRISNSTSLEHYIEVKPSKGFLDNADVTVNGSTLIQEDPGIDIYSGYINPGVGFTAGDVITSTGGTIRVSGIPMDDAIPIKYMYDGHETAFNITPMTTLVAESMALAGTPPTPSNINHIKETLIHLIDPDNLLGGDISKIDGDPEKIPALEGLGHTIYFTIKGVVDTLNTLGYTTEETHVSRLWGSIADTYENSQNPDFDDILIEIVTNPDFGLSHTMNDVDVFSSIVRSVYQKATEAQASIINAQQSGDKTAFKDASMNLVYTAETLSGIAPVIRDKTSGKTPQTISNFVNNVSELISENIDLVRQKAVEDPDNLKDEIAAINMLESLFINKIINECDAGDITPDSVLCFAIPESDIDSIIAALSELPPPEGIIDWNPKDGVVINTITPDFDLTFSDPVDKTEIEKYFIISIANTNSETAVVVKYINGDKWISIRIPSENTKILKKITEDEYINIEWNEESTKATLHVGSYTFEGKTYTLADGVKYRFTFQILDGAIYQNGLLISPQIIGPAEFTVLID